MALAVFFFTFILLMLLGAPVGFTFLMPGIIYMLLTDVPLVLTGQTMLQQFLKFVLLAIPLFILAGEIMNTAGITQRIFAFASAFCGHVRGCLGHVNVVASMIFAGISGSSAADAAGLGRVEIQAMRERGYRPEFAAAITAASSTIGPIIPPSIGLVLYGAIAEVGVDYLFMAGILPGTVLGIAFMLAIWLEAVTGREICPITPWPGVGTLSRTFLEALPALVAPVVIVGGILTGVFTPTEAGAMAVLIALGLGIAYRQLTLDGLLGALVRTVRSTAAIMFILATVAIFAWVLTVERVPDHVAATMFALSDQTWVLWLLILATLLFLGCFESASANLLIVTPILVPIAPAMGIDLVHLGVVLVFALAVGQLTPPVGITLFIVTDISGVPMGRIIRALWPYLAAMVIALLIVTYWPQMVLLIPEWLGYSPPGG